MQNDYLKDARLFLNDAAKRVVDGIDDGSLPTTVMLAALGVERLLKGILFSVNPLYVYKNQDFKNTVPIVYPDRLVAGTKSREIATEPNRDVYSFRAALARCSAVSKTTAKHTSLLHRLASQRDIVAHCELSQLDRTLCGQLLKRDLFSLLFDYANELGIATAKLMGPKEMALQKLAAENQDDVKERVTQKLALHLKKWEQLKNTPHFCESMNSKTTSRLAIVAKNSDVVGTTVACPACKHDAIVLLEPDYEIMDGEGVLTGVFATELRCFYCKLHISEYDELDQLRIQQIATTKLESAFDGGTSAPEERLNVSGGPRPT
jgi:hypothetical protein